MATELREAPFVIDDQQRVVQWSYAAAGLTGVPQSVAVGRPCYQLVQGRDLLGRLACRPGCLARRALQDGHVKGRCALLLRGIEAPRVRVVCELVALPRVPGGALATLTKRGPGPGASHGDGQAASTLSFRGSVEHVLRDLAAVTALSTSLPAGNFEQSIERALGWVRDAVDAEAAELFLADRRGGDMLLTAYRGPFPTAFAQITRFHPGEGFPGLVMSRGEPLLTNNLPEDPRYLRTRVKQKGFRSYVCVPLMGPKGPVGSLNIASRRPDFDVGRAQRLLTWASGPLCASVEAGLAVAGETVGVVAGETLQGGKEGLDSLLGSVLRQLMAVGKASRGALLLYDRELGGLVRKVAEGESPAIGCPEVKLGRPDECPALASGQGLALYGPRHAWPRPCQDMRGAGKTVYCVPLIGGGQAVGVALLGYGEHNPSPPTAYLAPLLKLAGRGACAIGQEWARARKGRATLAAPVAAQQDHGPERVPGGGAHPSATGEAAGPSGHLFLEVRCFGGFELYRRGRLVTPDMFQRRAALSLLKILLIYGGRRIHRDVLAEHLWPEADPRAAANRLYVVVHTLRHMVEPRQGNKLWQYVRREGDYYHFNLDASCWIDIMEFRSHLRLAERLHQRKELAGAIRAYETAAGLYRGDLLEDEPYSQWCLQEREHLRETCLEALQRLANLHLERGGPERSAQHFRHALRLDPLREEAHRGLMRALWVAGRRDEALREYEVCRDTLRRELDVGPLPDTERLHALIRNNASP
ncbi:MAG: GAF domain-containing protein [Chloroflexi bacterium]|nr:GAF domain-containing protein [Chloroflexota bacterium]